MLNVQWLTDLMLGHLEALKLPPQSKYQQFGSEDDFKVELWRVGHLLGKTYSVNLRIKWLHTVQLRYVVT